MAPPILDIIYQLLGVPQLNQIKKLVIDKPIQADNSKAIKTFNKPIEEPIKRKSTTERKQKKDDDYD